MSEGRNTNIATKLFLIGIFSILGVFSFPDPSSAATGIHSRINFQGKVVNDDGTNVTDGNYDFVFRIYTASTGGSAIWTETWNYGTAQIPVDDGIFQTELGTHVSLPGSIDFNTDNIYLSVEFAADGEMSPRIRFTAVPYAFNAEKVSGLTVTDTTGTLTVANGKTVSFADAFTTSGAFPLTFTATASTSVTLPTTGTLATLAGTEEFTNKTIGSTGLTFSGAATDIAAASGEGLTILGNAASSFTTTTGTLTLAAAGSGTVGTVQIGAGGAGSATPDFFGLDVKSTTGDPSGGFEGAMYYNAYDDRFRCYQGSGWTDCIGSGSGGMSIGGTITSATQGSILFAGSAGILAQDNANFFWDDSTNRLGLGTATPAAMLSLFGTSNAIRLSYDASHYTTLSANGSGDLAITGSSVTDSSVTLGNDTANDAAVLFDNLSQDYYLGVDDTDSAFKIGLGQTMGVTPALAIGTSGNVGIGTVGPSRRLDVLDGTNPQFRLTQTDGTVFTDFQTTASGDLYIDPSGNDVGIGDVSPDHTLDVAGNIGLDASGYINFGDTDGSTGYGFRDSSGTLQYRNSGGSWTSIGSGGGGMSIGGTITSATQGSILFAGSAGILAQDNANFFWDDSTDRLGLGTATPAAMLDIYGTGNGIRLSYDASNYATLASSSNGDLMLGSSNAAEAAIIVGSGTAGQDVSVQFDGASQDYHFGVDDTDAALKLGLGTVVGTGTLFTAAADGAVTIGSSSTEALTIESGTTGAIVIGADASAETITIGTGAAAKTVTIGSTDTTSTTTIQSGTGGIVLQSEGTASEGLVQVGAGGGGGGSTTPDLFVLDAKSDAGNPSAIEGAMYYSQNTNKFRCYEGSAWKDCLFDPSTFTPTAVSMDDEIPFVDVSNSDTNASVKLEDAQWEQRKRLPNRGFSFYTDFVQETSATATDNGIAETNSGTSAATTQQAIAAAGRIGTVRSTTGTTATGRAALTSGVTAVPLGNGSWFYETAVNVTTLSDATNRYQLVIGFLDTVSAANQADGVYFLYDEGGVSTSSTAAAYWQTATVSNSARTFNTSLTQTTVAAGSWVRLGIEVNAAGTSATFYINGTAVATHSANIPTGTARALGFGSLLIKSVGTTARTVDYDYVNVVADLTTAR